MRTAKHRRTTALYRLPFYTHLSKPYSLQYEYIPTSNDHVCSYLIVTLLSHSISYLISKLVLYLLQTFSYSTSTSLDQLSILYTFSHYLMLQSVISSPWLYLLGQYTVLIYQQQVYSSMYLPSCYRRHYDQLCTTFSVPRCYLTTYCCTSPH